MKYRGLLLDFYGTLVEEDGPAIRSIVSRIERHRPECSGASLAQAWGQEFARLLATSHGVAFRTQRDLEIESLTIVLTRVGASLDPVELSADQFAYWQSPALRPGAAEFLASCPVPVCVVSNIDRADLETAIRNTGLSLPLSVTSEDARSYKPRPELFEAGLRSLGLGPHEVLHVGDSLGSDVAGANALEIDVAWVNAHGRAAPEGARIVRECSDLRDLLPLLDGDAPSS
ncbi:HAD family hydrolase [Parenemella sanctibonifatiensis]|uniref:HAD family hydrolase n=1 Tax=Parenemella sanctibonifatiensis TaxID=2016505 RepID=A0A255E4E8_9ACTN|nr:HAD family hydrolase [Parenemella sanctibonifatiensis]OYN86424.1 HAD family hydrolase [Parenemella sanctibonifatiensis]